jgi:hypothetical protein
MDIQLSKSNFVDGRFSQNFADNKRVTFIVVQESFHGNNRLGVVDRVNIFIELFDPEGKKIEGNFSSSVIGIGDALAGILTEEPTLLGKMLTWDNMEQCVIRLYG